MNKVHSIEREWKDELVLLKDPQIEFRLDAVIRKAENTSMEKDSVYIRALNNTLLLYRTHKFQECFSALGDLFAYINHIDAIKNKECWSLVIKMKRKDITFVQSLATGEIINIYAKT